MDGLEQPPVERRRNRAHAGRGFSRHELLNAAVSVKGPDQALIDLYMKVQRYWMQIVAATAASLLALGAIFVIARRRRPQTVGMRLHQAKSSIGDRLERPISSMRSAAERIAR